jgi:hypothetical protein
MTKIKQIIAGIGIDHNLSHLGGKPPKSSEKGGGNS